MGTLFGSFLQSDGLAVTLIDTNAEQNPGRRFPKLSW